MSIRRTSLVLSALAFGCQGASDSATELSSDSKAIIGGTKGQVGQFPTTVAISNGGLCTGTLVAPDLILTAAHCILPQLLQVGSQEQVTAMTQVIFDADDLFGSGNNVIVRQAAATIPHPDFSINGLGDNDIGLIRLQSPITDRAPTPINRFREDAPVGIATLQVGYGASQVGGGGAGTLFVLEGQKTVSCSSFGIPDSNLLCFSQIDGRGKCQGDSGGPTFLTVDGVERVVGVTSFGDQNCAQFGADTRVDAELDFLYRHAPELQCQADGACNDACGAGDLPVDTDCPVCASDADCGDTEICGDEGSCIAAPFQPGGEGSDCTRNEDCESGMCATAGENSYCTSVCGDDSQCFDGFDCVPAGEQSVCWPASSGDDGGCSTSGGSPSWVGLALLGLAVALRRRRNLDA